MFRKTISILAIAIMLSVMMASTATAQDERTPFTERIQEVTFDRIENGEKPHEFKPLELIENNQTNMSETARDKLLEISDEFRQRHRQRLNCTGNCYYQARNISDDRIEVSENKPVRILGIATTARQNFEVDDRGDIVRERQNLAEFLRDLGLAREIAVEQVEA